ncbi:hypothetical protein [Salininema proteolyticum]|uniref:Integral membrane protein n=1 Tax=Salininema proteolyticum TaxID=1607685 RepID=A0ABV8U113_9ACTN
MLSEAAATTAGIGLITIVTIEFGGTFLLRIVRGQVPMTDFQKAFARAGHAHAGVLVTLGLVCAVLADATALEGLPGWLARAGVLVSAALISAGFFFSSMGREVTRPNKWIALLWAGAALLAASVLTLGVGLIAA